MTITENIIIVIYNHEANGNINEVFGLFASEKEAEDWVEKKQLQGLKGEFLITSISESF